MLPQFISLGGGCLCYRICSLLPALCHHKMFRPAVVYCLLLISTACLATSSLLEGICYLIGRNFYVVCCLVGHMLMLRLMLLPYWQTPSAVSMEKSRLVENVPKNFPKPFLRPTLSRFVYVPQLPLEMNVSAIQIFAPGGVLQIINYLGYNVAFGCVCRNRNRPVCVPINF